MRTFLLLGAVNAALAVALGALGAHGLASLPGAGSLATWQTANQYHACHALGLCVVGLMAGQWPASRWIAAAGWLMLTGIVLFSGSLYLRVITGAGWIGLAAPPGGMALILSWLLLLPALRAGR